MDTSILEDIGLTHAEIKVYITLLKLGQSSAGPIVEKSRLQNSVVHRTLHRLIEKAIITYIVEGKKKYYQAINPKMLLDYIEDKKKRVELILPELLAEQASAEKKQEVVVYKGVRGLRAILNEIVDTDAREYFAYGGPKISNEMLGEYTWESLHNKREMKGISAKLIFNESLRFWGNHINKKKLTRVRYTKKEFEQLTETIICCDKVAILIYSENPYGILIQDQTVAESYKKFFAILWKDTIS